MVTFVLGGMTGIILANPPVDYQVHNTLFPGRAFPQHADPGPAVRHDGGLQYWFPKAFGFRLYERWGPSPLCWMVGFYLAFMPLYVLGLPGWRGGRKSFRSRFPPLARMLRSCGAFFLFAGLVDAVRPAVGQRARPRREQRVLSAIRGTARGLEWSISAPPPEYNFATIPQVSRRDCLPLAQG